GMASVSGPSSSCALPSARDPGATLAGGMRVSRLRALLFTTAVALTAPATALGQQSLAITSPTGFPAGGHPSYTTHIGLDTSAGTPSTLTIRLAPGVLASPSANP